MSATTNDKKSWQTSVPQKYRSDEISKIATELAGLEPSATMSSKLGLASKFEDTVFKTATSLNDYHKKINKKLNKLKRKYEKKPNPGPVDSEQSIEESIVLKKRNLRMLYGDTMRLIAENGKIAAAGYPRLVDHIDKANEYATEIGAIPSELAVKVLTGRPIVVPKRPPRETLKHLELLENTLEQKITTLREWILKYSQEERFFGEKLEQMEKNILLNTDTDYCGIFFNGLKEALQKEGVADLNNMTTADLVNGIKTYQQRVKETVPIPRNKEDEKTASLLYIDKIRAASQICLMYILIAPNDQKLKLEFAGSLRQANNIIFEAMKLLKETFKETESETGSDPSSKSKIKLEDAWNKVLEYDAPVEENIDAGGVITIDDDGEDGQGQKEDKPLAIRSKVLLIGGRKPPSNLVGALKRKHAILCLRPGIFSSSYLKLQFGDVFEMLIYFSPLLVRIRALAQSTQSKKPQNDVQNQYQVMGVSGSVDLVGPLIVKRLEYASLFATKCLRRCFADQNCRANSSDFETEILEGNALLKFLTLARNTYCPNWVDAKLD